jgi:hypothetical protein
LPDEFTKIIESQVDYYDRDGHLVSATVKNITDRIRSMIIRI